MHIPHDFLVGVLVCLFCVGSLSLSTFAFATVVGFGLWWDFIGEPLGSISIPKCVWQISKPHEFTFTSGVVWQEVGIRDFLNPMNSHLPVGPYGEEVAI